MAKTMDQRFFVNTSTRALDMATIIAAKALPRKNMSAMPLPVQSPENKASGGITSITTFVFALADPFELADTIETGDVVFVQGDTEEATRRTDDDAVLPVMCLRDDEGAVPFGVVAQSALAAAVRDTSYVGIVCHGPALVKTDEVFAFSSRVAIGEKVRIGAENGIRATLMVQDWPHSRVLIE